MKISEFEKIILRQLYNSKDGLLVFTLFQRLKLTPSQLFLFIDKFKKLGFISYEDEKLELTSIGKQEIIERKLEKLKNKDKFASIPEFFLSPPLRIDDFYIPKLSETKSIFKEK